MHGGHTYAEVACLRYRAAWATTSPEFTAARNVVACSLDGRCVTRGAPKTCQAPRCTDHQWVGTLLDVGIYDAGCCNCCVSWHELAAGKGPRRPTLPAAGPGKAIDLPRSCSRPLFSPTSSDPCWADASRRAQGCTAASLQRDFHCRCTLLSRAGVSGVVQGWVEACREGRGDDYCTERTLHAWVMQEARVLREQLATALWDVGVLPAAAAQERMVRPHVERLATGRPSTCCMHPLVALRELCSAMLHLG
jgi:hypothetical protein